ncbi:MAG: zinc ribbon domain-containing protein [Planctomycetia bacterium]|nr:zinc ribbon domain-containing protein [Planctomycetia bacterium]
MPTYDYECDACHHKFELFQSINDSHKKKCPECGKPKLRRLFGTGAAIVFKGSGFYQTDYRSESYKKRAAEDKSASSGGTESKGDAQGDAKPAETPAKKSESGGSTSKGKKKASE